jgi:uncharacterized membrane protein YoaK (UPF0700 family)
MKPLLALCLSWLSGLVDVVCLTRFHGFAALQTGNMVHIGIELAHVDGPNKLAAIGTSLAGLFSNFAGVFTFCAVAEFCSRPVLVAAPVLGMLTASAGLLDAFATGGCSWAICAVAASFGAMNFCTSPNTPLEGRLFTMVSLATGNLQKSAKMLYKVARGHKISDPDALAAQIAAMVVLGTLFGAISGGVALAYEVNVPLMRLPAGAGQCAVLLWHDHLLRPRFNQPSAALLEPLTDAGGGAKKAGPETATTSSTASWSRFSLSS